MYQELPADALTSVTRTHDPNFRARAFVDYVLLNLDGILVRATCNREHGRYLYFHHLRHWWRVPLWDLQLDFQTHRTQVGDQELTLRDGWLVVKAVDTR